MPHIAESANDVFVSYATPDNVRLANGEGWVDNLVDKLMSEVGSRLGTSVVLAPEHGSAGALRFWNAGPAIDDNRPRIPQILDAARGSAILLVVMSAGYLKSEWCQGPLREFLAVVRSRRAEGSVFVINAHDIGLGERPEEFGNIEGFKFWSFDRRVGAKTPLGRLDANDAELAGAIVQISHKLSEQLKRLKAGRAGQAASAAQGPKPRVFLARSTDDLERRERDVRNHLEQAGCHVLPDSLYPHTSVAEFERAMLRDLEQCTAFIQLLGEWSGRVEFEPDVRLPRLQHEIAARARLRSPNLQVLQWHSASVSLTDVDEPEYRALLEGARVCGIEELKREAVEAARRKPPEARAASLTPVVYVSADSLDLDLAKRIADYLGRYVEIWLPLSHGTEEDAQKDFAESLSDCDGFVLVYGMTGPEWVRGRLRHGRKILATRERPLRMRAIYRGPPPDKPELGTAGPDLLVLDGRAGIDERALREFVEKLR